MSEWIELLTKIQGEVEERKLLALAYACHGAVKGRIMHPRHYADCMVELSRKLGFPPLEDNLDEAAAKYLGREV